MTAHVVAADDGPRSSDPAGGQRLRRQTVEMPTNAMVDRRTASAKRHSFGPVTKRRTYLSFLASGLWPTFATAALEGHLPDFSPMHWAVFLAGSCVIALAFIYLEGRFSPRNSGDGQR